MRGINTAKGLYREICSIGGYRLGPFLLLDESTSRKVDKLRPSLLEILSDIEVLGERVVRAPSPYHAALMMMVQIEYSTAHDGPLIEENGKIGIFTSKQRSLFRGQVDSTWDIVSKKERPNIDKDLETRAIKAFCALLARLFRSMDLPTPPAQAYVATAQHYGLATHLLDFTADPSVAVYFATNGNKRREDQEAVVFLLPLIDALGHGAKIILPPPFVKRLYIQRGVFVEAPRQTSTSIHDLCWKIHFPIDPSFEVIRENGIVDLLLTDPWLENAVQWARGWAKTGKDFPTEQEAVEQIFYAACEKIGYPEYLSRQYAMEQTAMWVDFTSDMLYWLGIIVSGDKEYIDPIVVDAFTRDNSVLMEAVTYLFEAEAFVLEKQGQSDLANGRRQLIQIFRNALSKVHSDK